MPRVPCTAGRGSRLPSWAGLTLLCLLLLLSVEAVRGQRSLNWFGFRRRAETQPSELIQADGDAVTPDLSQGVEEQPTSEPLHEEPHQESEAAAPHEEQHQASEPLQEEPHQESEPAAPHEESHQESEPDAPHGEQHQESEPAAPHEEQHQQSEPLPEEPREQSEPAAQHEEPHQESEPAAPHEEPHQESEPAAQHGEPGSPSTEGYVPSAPLIERIDFLSHKRSSQFHAPFQDFDKECIACQMMDPLFRLPDAASVIELADLIEDIGKNGQWKQTCKILELDRIKSECPSVGEGPITSAYKSFMNGPPIVHVREGPEPTTTRWYLEAVTNAGYRQALGGDFWQVHAKSEDAIVAGVITDFSNGTYAVDFHVRDPGAYEIHAGLVKARVPCVQRSHVPACAMQAACTGHPYRMNEWAWHCANGRVFQGADVESTAEVWALANRDVPKFQVSGPPPPARITLPECRGAAVRDGRWLRREIACLEAACGDERNFHEGAMHEKLPNGHSHTFSPFACRYIRRDAAAIRAASEALQKPVALFNSPASWALWAQIAERPPLKLQFEAGNNWQVVNAPPMHHDGDMYLIPMEGHLRQTAHLKDTLEEYGTIIYDGSPELAADIGFEGYTRTFLTMAKRFHRAMVEAGTRVIVITWMPPKPSVFFECPAEAGSQWADDLGRKCEGGGPSVGGPSVQRLMSVHNCMDNVFAPERIEAYNALLRRVFEPIGAEILDREKLQDAGQALWYSRPYMNFVEGPLGQDAVHAILNAVLF